MDKRHWSGLSYLDAIRPQPGWSVDRAILATYSADLVAVVGGRFSPVQLAEIPTVHKRKLILFDAWGSADGITDHDFSPSYTFRVSLKDSYAMPTMMRHAVSKGAGRVALLLPNTGWGRSNAAAAEAYLADHGAPQLVATRWYNWGDRSLASHYQAMRDAGAQSIVLVANDIEGSVLLRYMMTLPEQQRLPIISHWGVTGGHFVESSEGAVAKLDFSVIQTFSLFSAAAEPLARVREGLQRRYGISRLEEVESPVGLGHAYDIVHLLTMAIEQAGSTDRPAVRDALENLGHYQGLVRDYQRPFDATNHDALKLEDVLRARYDAQGVIRPIGGTK